MYMIGASIKIYVSTFNACKFTHKEKKKLTFWYVELRNGYEWFGYEGTVKVRRPTKWDRWAWHIISTIHIWLWPKSIACTLPLFTMDFFRSEKALHMAMQTKQSTSGTFLGYIAIMLSFQGKVKMHFQYMPNPPWIKNDTHGSTHKEKKH